MPENYLTQHFSHPVWHFQIGLECHIVILRLVEEARNFKFLAHVDGCEVTLTFEYEWTDGMINIIATNAQVPANTLSRLCPSWKTVKTITFPHELTPPEAIHTSGDPFYHLRFLPVRAKQMLIN
jgi:hypothetical protein